MKRVIFHIDVNSAYLSWEAVSRLAAGDTVDLREIPAAVGGDIETRHGVILAKSIPAKKYGIVTGEPVVDALRKCPDLTLVKPHHTMYREKSRAFIVILQQYSDTIEQFSVDEAFVDMTGTERLFGTPVEAANRIREQVYREQGFTVMARHWSKPHAAAMWSRSRACARECCVWLTTAWLSARKHRSRR